MDLISKQSIEVNSLALNALASRNKALSANIANADVPGYQRLDVKFEDQLSKIINEENFNQKQKENYSANLLYLPNSIQANTESTSNINKLLGMVNGSYNIMNQSPESYSSFDPAIQATDDPAVKPDGNNVNVEYEMAEMVKNGTKYSAIATFQTKEFKNLNDVIRGANS